MNILPSVQFYPTLRCNLHCHFCFNNGLQAAADVTIANFATILAVLKEAGVQCIDVLGGEPTLHPGLVPLLDMINRQGMKSNLSSNGTRIDVLNALAAQFDRDFLRVGISLNDQEVPEDLHHYIIRHRPVLKSVLTMPYMIPSSCKRYIGMPGIEYFLIYMDIVDHRGLENSMPFYQYYQELCRLKNCYSGLRGVFCSGLVSETGDDLPTTSARCPAGTMKLSIKTDGSVYPCYLFFRYKEFELGNILRDDFQRIWENPLLNFFRQCSVNKCPRTGCTLFPSCHGGCPAMSYLFYHDLEAPDPRCLPHSNRKFT